MYSSETFPEINVLGCVMDRLTDQTVVWHWGNDLADGGTFIKMEEDTPVPHHTVTTERLSGNVQLDIQTCFCFPSHLHMSASVLYATYPAQHTNPSQHLCNSTGVTALQQMEVIANEPTATAGSGSFLSGRCVLAFLSGRSRSRALALATIPRPRPVFPTRNNLAYVTY